MRLYATTTSPPWMGVIGLGALPAAKAGGEGEADGAGDREAEGEEEPHGARLFVVVQVDVAEQAGAIARRPALVLWHRLRSGIAKEQDERGDVGVG